MTINANAGHGLLRLIFGVVGVLLLMGAAGSVGTRLAPPAGWASTQGVVVENVETSADSFQPVVEYRVDDQSYRVRSAVSQSPARSIGSPTEVWYERANPAVAKTASFFDRFLVGMILGLIGLPFVLVYLGLRWRGGRRDAVTKWRPPAESKREEGRRAQQKQRWMGVAFMFVAVAALGAGVALSFVVDNPLSLFSLWINVAIFGAVGGALLWSTRSQPEVLGRPVQEPGTVPAVGEDRSEPEGTVPDPYRGGENRERLLYQRDGVDPVSDDGPPLLR